MVALAPFLAATDTDQLSAIQAPRPYSCHLKPRQETSREGSVLGENTGVGELAADHLWDGRTDQFGTTTGLKERVFDGLKAPHVIVKPLKRPAAVQTSTRGP